MNEKPFAGVLFASDYDHTLSAPDGTVPEANRAGIRRFIDAGGRFCIASGRSVRLLSSRLELVPVNGVRLQDDCLLFLDIDPNLTVRGCVPFTAGMKFAVTYHYYPLTRFQHEQPGKSLLRALNALKLHNEAEQQELQAQLQASRAEIRRLNDQLQDLVASRAAYENSLETVYESSSWKLTAPLRAFRRLFGGKK